MVAIVLLVSSYVVYRVFHGIVLLGGSQVLLGVAMVLLWCC